MIYTTNAVEALNRNALLVGAGLDQASGTAEREEALKMVDTYRPVRRGKRPRRITLGADKAYDVEAFVRALKSRCVTPHIAIDGHLSKTRQAAQDRDRRGATTRHPGYAVSQVIRKRIEEAFGWIKTVAGLRKTRHRGIARVGWMFTLAGRRLQFWCAFQS